LRRDRRGRRRRDHRRSLEARAGRAGRGARDALDRHRQARADAATGAGLGDPGARGGPLDPGHYPRPRRADPAQAWRRRGRRLRPGAEVAADTILLELSNPEVELAAVDAEAAVRAAQAELTNLKVQLQSQILNQKAQAANVESSYHQAKLQAEANEQLAKDGLIASLTLKLSQVTADELAGRAEIEQKRLDISSDAAQAQ